MNADKTVPHGALYRSRRGSVLVAILPTFLLILAGGAVLYFAVQNGTPVDLVDAVLYRVMEPIILVVEKIFAIIAPLSPIFAAIIPVWIVFSDDTPATIEILAWSAAYGVSLFALVLYAGIDIQIMALIQGSWTGSIIGGALGLASSIGNVLIGVLMALTYWTAGLVLELIILIFKAITGLGHVAESGVKGARRAQVGILDRIRGGGK